MARRGDSVIGIDLGKHAFKAVSLRRKSDSRFVLTGFASREVPEQFENADQLAQELKHLMKEAGGGAKACVAAISDPACLLRIVEQPTTPVELGMRTGAGWLEKNTTGMLPKRYPAPIQIPTHATHPTTL